MFEWVLVALLIGSAVVAEVGFWKNSEWVVLSGVVGMMVSGCLLLFVALGNLVALGSELGEVTIW